MPPKPKTEKRTKAPTTFAPKPSPRTVKSMYLELSPALHARIKANAGRCDMSIRDLSEQALEFAMDQAATNAVYRCRRVRLFEGFTCTPPAYTQDISPSDFSGLIPLAKIGPPGFTIYLQANNVSVEKDIQSVWVNGDCVLAVSGGNVWELVPVQELFIVPPFEVR